jgi:hypothetical protein
MNSAFALQRIALVVKRDSTMVGSSRAGVLLRDFWINSVACVIVFGF